MLGVFATLIGFPKVEDDSLAVDVVGSVLVLSILKLIETRDPFAELFTTGDDQAAARIFPAGRTLVGEADKVEYSTAGRVEHMLELIWSVRF